MPSSAALTRWAGTRAAEPGALFTCRNRERRETGAELVGTRPDRPFRAMTTGSRKADGGFWIARKTEPTTALLVEGAIDALSAWILADRTQIDIVISTAGATGRMPEWIGGLQLETVFCGYDADPVGDQAAEMLEAQNPTVRRMRPDGDGDVKDWNEILLRQRARALYMRDCATMGDWSVEIVEIERFG
ncbi:MAG: toprim domain-containing protein [Paracoccaceae bacterium]|nr:toprim domain-containing protein [Paracoccaceae bacterium]